MYTIHKRIQLSQTVDMERSEKFNEKFKDLITRFQ